MDRETGSPPREMEASSGLPPIFQKPTYPSGRPAVRPERTPEPGEAVTHEERPGDDGPGDGSVVAGEAVTEGEATPDQEGAAPRRRRRRGGRGRGRRGRGRGDTSADDAAEPPEGAGAVDTDDAVIATDEARTDGEAIEEGRRPRRSRRRRSRSRSAATDGGDAPADVEAGVNGDGAAVTDESQRDDAQPDWATGEGDGDRSDAPRRRRRRGGRGRRRSTATDAPADPVEGATPAPGGKPERGTSGPQTLEERVAAGGPTRGLRARTPRARGRRPREQHVVPPRITDKLMVITERGERDQIAVLEENLLVQHYVTRRGATSMVGNVYLGRIQNVLPGMEAAFVDIGRGRNGVLYAGEVNYSPEDLDGKPPRIENVLRSGQAVMVQVTKDPMGGKGARLTAQVSLPGRFLVLAPNQDASGISRRLSDNARKRLKTILNALRPKGHGVIVRTAAEGATEEEVARDLERLTSLWDQIQRAAKKAKAPAVLYEEPELTVRVVRDLFTDEEFRGLVTDSERVHDEVLAYVRDVAPDLVSKITLHRGPLPVFEHYRVDEQILKALDRKVWLPSGGYLIVERTEAMTIIDVNTGKSVGKTNLEETVLNTNLEAAREAARQLRLRDIGGIIVIDFIDMLLEQNKRRIEDTMREALAIDKTRSQVFEIGPLGLMQVTRKRVSGGLVDSFSETCPTCEGRGILVRYDVG
jgi:ribonuclease E